MNAILGMVRVVRSFFFKMIEVYPLFLISVLVVGSVLGLGEKWLVILLFVLFSPVLYFCGRCIWQYYLGPKFSAALVRSLAQRYVVGPRENPRATVVKAFYKDPMAFYEERKEAQKKLDALSSRIYVGDFDWPDISWWRAYNELIELMDEVLSE